MQKLEKFTERRGAFLEHVIAKGRLILDQVGIPGLLRQSVRYLDPVTVVCLPVGDLLGEL
jgi:hypothetical protein